MSVLTYVLAALFLPLFPLSMAFNALFGWGRNSWFRAILLLAWPQIGLTLLPMTDAPAPDWVLGVALFTAVLYAFRAIALREVGQWTGYLATSAWALLWLALLNDTALMDIRFYALGFSIPLALLAFLGARLEKHFGAAYTGLYGGLVHSLPRFSGVLVIVVLAIVASPLFPGFFAMVMTIVAAVPTAPWVALVVAITWLLWSWAGVRLLQGLVVGAGNEIDAPDLSTACVWLYTVALLVLLVGGLYVSGDLL